VAPFVLAALGAFGLSAFLTFATALATGPFFLAGGAAAGSVSGALRFLNSGGMLRVRDSGCEVGAVVLELSLLIGANNPSDLE